MSVLFVSALPEELAAIGGRARVLHVGVGKLQAAVTLAHHLATTREPVSLVVNAGTAGTLREHRVGDLVEVATVVQHDFDHEALSALVGRPLPGGPIELSGAPGADAWLATGDRFITDPVERARLARRADLVDMEGYAVAATCIRFGVPARIVKCVSDTADLDADISWREALDVASHKLAQWAAQRGFLA
ncbi:MAG: nucleoside phosphorylase [Actinobacteria bacterium]|nr:nucleoside phosphorylase [Actinomycetota bacterium]